MWRLVVANVLPCHRHSVDMVVHECGDTIVGRRVGGVDVEVGRVRGVPEDEFFSPVAHDVGLKVWSGLCPVASIGVSRFVYLFSVAQR